MVIIWLGSSLYLQFQNGLIDGYEFTPVSPCIKQELASSISSNNFWPKKIGWHLQFITGQLPRLGSRPSCNSHRSETRNHLRRLRKLRIMHQAWRRNAASSHSKAQSTHVRRLNVTFFLRLKTFWHNYHCLPVENRKRYQQSMRR